MKNKKNFYIVRYYLNDEVQWGTMLTRKQASQYSGYIEQLSENEAGGLTMWFRIDIQPKNQ